MHPSLQQQSLRCLGAMPRLVRLLGVRAAHGNPLPLKAVHRQESLVRLLGSVCHCLARIHLLGSVFRCPGLGSPRLESVPSSCAPGSCPAGTGHRGRGARGKTKNRRDGETRTMPCNTERKGSELVEASEWYAEYRSIGIGLRFQFLFQNHPNSCHCLYPMPIPNSSFNIYIQRMR